eukprot:m.218049 g.218049  ORF g.218049 m.218049 type:complete len:795 (-) comp33250_c0_seq3:266-2650(-)
MLRVVYVLVLLGMNALSVSTKEISNNGFKYTTPLTQVSTDIRTFQAGKHPTLGLHRTAMETALEVDNQLLSLETMPNKLLFAPGAEFFVHGENGKRKIELDKSLFHVGKVSGEPDSHVHISVHPSGGVDGVVHRQDGSKYVLEALARYPDMEGVPSHHDTAVFPMDSLTMEAMHGLGDHTSSACPVKGAHANNTSNNTSNNTRGASSVNDIPSFMKSMRQSESLSLQERQRRSDPIDCLTTTNKRCSCNVALVGDYEFYTGPNCNKHLEYGIQHMVNLVIGANKIYRQTNFDGMKGLGFVVGSAQIFETRTAFGNPTPRYNYDSGSEFLNAVTDGLANNFTDMCSSMLFTHRDFQEGILGMAWVASNNGFGGICDPRYNCGFNTGINYGVEISPFVASLVFAHEIGHNCGAEHDPDDDLCSPGDDAGGNYIMFAAATDGTHTNNHEFSTCSRESMGTVMNYLRDACFIEAGVDDCGNGIVEGDEECDCGTKCTPSSCCTSDCKVNTARGHQCSPQNPVRYPCCTSQCMFKSVGATCHENDECAEFAVCDGTSAGCPLTPKPNNASCHCKDNNCTTNPNSNPQFCHEGICDYYICELFGAKQCGLPYPHACELGCIGDGFGDGDTCINTFFTTETPQDFGNGRHLFPGTACMNNRGTCGKSGECNYVNVDDMERADGWVSSTLNKYWEEVLISFSVVLFIGVLFVQHRVHVRSKKKRAAHERAYLLAAANQEYEDAEDNRAFDGKEDGSSYALMDISVRPVLADQILNDSMELETEYSMPDSPDRQHNQNQYQAY